MTFKRLLLMMAMLFVFGGVAAADPKAGDKPLSARTFTFKYKQADKAAAVIKSLVSAEGSISIQPSANALQVTDRPENLKQIARAIAEFDEPAKAFKVYVRLVAASRVENAGKVPRNLEDVASKLAMLKYNTFDSVGEATIEASEGDPGTLDMASGYRAEFKLGEYDAASDSVKVADFRISKLQSDQLTPVVRPTTLNLGIGQTYIVGASKAPGSQHALMIVLIARR